MSKKFLQDFYETIFFTFLSRNMSLTFKETKIQMEDIHFRISNNLSSLIDYSDFIITHYKTYLDYLENKKRLFDA